METGTRQGSGYGSANDPGAKKSERKLEYFWLCEKCARSMTLTFDRAAGVSTRRTLNAAAASVS